MQSLKNHTGKVALLDRINVDTDQIIPKQFLKAIGKTGFGKNLFFDWRYLDNGEPNPDFELNRPEFQGASILLTGDNFGCGSSREHAPWALDDYGFKVIIAESFGDIFQNNCYKNGMLPIVVSKANSNALKKEVVENSPTSFSIDLENQCLSTPKGLTIDFDVDPFRKEFLIKGIDDIGWTQQFEVQISAYENKKKVESSWLWAV